MSEDNSAADPLLWLEDIDGDAALRWVEAQNRATLAAFAADPLFASLQNRLRAVFDADARIPYVAERGGYWYNFWQDAGHAKGLWRRTTPASYRGERPAWDVILDLDALAAAENANWVWRGADALRPDFDRCLIALSRGGGDATVTREFDVPSRSFVAGGFALPEAKGSASWIDRDTTFVATDFGAGSLTTSGYPRSVRRWRRGTPLAAAETVFAGDADDISVRAYRDHAAGRDLIVRQRAFYRSELYELTATGPVKIAKPDDADALLFGRWLLIETRSAWTVGGVTHPAGALLAADYPGWLAGERALTALFTPCERVSLASVARARSRLALTLLDNVTSRVELLTPDDDGWRRAPLTGLPVYGNVSVWPVDSATSDALWLSASGYLTPDSFWRADADEPVRLKALPAQFDAAGLAVAQHSARSDDGTVVPYFQIGPQTLPDGGAAALLYGYGGFEVPLLPGYSGAVGLAWLARGGVYVVANIRGGGEFGPRWHQAALKQNRQRAYEDFIAVADDLIARGVTTPPRLGIQGGSNGGLLVGNMYTRSPRRWGAVVCQVPLLDMRRYHRLLAGASWMAEYGDPDDPEQWAHMRALSPYHNIDRDADYPPLLLTTSTRDDRVHPGHARKMARALLDLGKPVYYYENIEGGHGGATTAAQRARVNALIYTFLARRLGLATADS